MLTLILFDFYSLFLTHFHFYFYSHFYSYFYFNFQSIFKKRNLRVTVCGKTSKRIKQSAKGGDENSRSSSGGKKTENNSANTNKSTGKRSFVTYNGTGNASIKGNGKGGDKDKDGQDSKRQKPAFTSRKLDSETDINAKNANKRINLKVFYPVFCQSNLIQSYLI